MKYLTLFFVGITFSLLSGCQSGTPRNESGPVQVTSSSHKAMNKVNADGDWLTLFHCQGNDYLLETKIVTGPGTIQLLLSGQGQAMEMPMTGGRIAAAKPVPKDLSGPFDNEAGSFTAVDQNGVIGTQLVGVFESSNRFAAILQGRNWNGASLMIGVRKGQKDELDRLLAQADSKLGQMVARSRLGAMFRTFQSKNQSRQCGMDETAWAKKIQQAIDQTQGSSRDSDHVKLASAMFSDPYFRPFFDDSLYDIGREDGQKFAAKLRNTNGCGQLDAGARLSRSVLNDITMVLDNRLPLTRNYVMINNAAGSVIQNWMATTEARLAAITRTYSEQPETGIKKIDDLASTAKVMNQQIWSPRTRSYEDQLAEARTLLIKKEFFDDFSRFLNTNINTFEDLHRLALFPSTHKASYSLLTEQEKARISARIQARVDSGNPDIVSAAKEFAARQKTISDLSANLVPIGSGKFSGVAQYTSSQNLNTVEDIFKTRKSEILDLVVQDNRIKMNQILSDSSAAETKLRNLVRLRSTFATSNQMAISEPILSAHTSELQQHSIDLLASLEPGITAKIKSAPSPARMNDLLAGLTAKEDKNTPVVQRIDQAHQKRMAELTAFRPVRNASQLSISSFTANGLNYETELMAIYLGDFDHARIDSQSVLASALFTNYLYAYGRHCDAYLPADKVPITESKCASEWVETDGWGNESRSCIRWVEVPTGLYADPVLYAAQKQQSHKAGINILGKMLSSSDPFSSRSIADDVLSLGKDMDNLVIQNQCSNAGLKRFENNLYNFTQGKKPLLLPGKETLAMVHSTRNVDLSADVLNLKSLLDDLIAENAKGWTMNRYISGSVGNIKVHSKNKDGSPASVSASYAFSSLNQRYQGNAILKFSDGRPACLYFSDAPQTCRHPSRGVINKYEKGLYQK